ncbi:MAG: type II secretion system F family protein [Actinomycetota bacterium]|nr:type II secretion system F family protein [Actinomycetota bacterium]
MLVSFVGFLFLAAAAGLALEGRERREKAPLPVAATVPPMGRRLAAAVNRYSPAASIDRLRRRIDLAGAQATWPLERALAARGFGVVATAPVAALWLLVARSGLALVVGGALVAGGYLAIDVVLARTGRARQQSIERRLPDVLDQITTCVEAGLGFDAALARLVRAEQHPLTDELGRVLQDVRLGVPRASALDALIVRTDNSDLRLLARAILQAERLGTPISAVLRAQSDDLRHRRRTRAEEVAMKLPVKMVVPLMVCILPALLLVLVGPAALRLADSGLGG